MWRISRLSCYKCPFSCRGYVGLRLSSQRASLKEGDCLLFDMFGVQSADFTS